MKHVSWLIFTYVFATGLSAQTGPPSKIGLAVGLQRGYNTLKINFQEAAGMMPEPAYSFQPAHDVFTFGQLIGHVANTQFSSYGPTVLPLGRPIIRG